ncbi:PREDICTED: peroxisome biogenesis protein 12 [Brassica oleracea var. oleracea]|uniref:Peroxisome biogenesis protein 12 n=1 Tax=Brassica oleracea var. oleracea TaxID=109376 RepID=A0A0D3CMT8_BRAOL|nr:PREDICTED: peroxisome biogenesis protein 12 [Brassica oleracea var. oleracea]
MLFQVGGDGTRPTFFEMAAAQQLPSSLRAALTYSLGVFALRRSFLHRILDYEDEFFAALMLVLEGHSLRTTDASFAESLYGLKRKSVRLRLRLSKGSGLEKRQRILSVVFLVVLPYFKSKLHGIYNKEREARLRESIWGEEDQGFDEADFFTGEEPVVSRGDSGDQELSVRVQVATRIKKFVAVCYPWIHTEGLSFTYQLLYLLDATGFYSLGVQVCRATGQELMDTSSRISKIRNHERERLRGPPWLKTVQGALLSCSYAVLDYAQTGLIAAVFIFKMMEWWYQSAEERMTAPTVYPPPPPPPSPKVAKEGIPLPPDRTLCALCLQKLANPSVVTVSGFVFSYSCVFKYVSQYKRCPVTLIPASVDQIRRLFHDT